MEPVPSELHGCNTPVSKAKDLKTVERLRGLVLFDSTLPPGNTFPGTWLIWKHLKIYLHIFSDMEVYKILWWNVKEILLSKPLIPSSFSCSLKAPCPGVWFHQWLKTPIMLSGATLHHLSSLLLSSPLTTPLNNIRDKYKLLCPKL